MADEDDIDDELTALDEADPASAKRAKSSLARSFEVYLGEFKRRSHGLTGAELHAEIDRFLERLVERHALSVPAGLRDEVRARLRGTIERDPSMGRLIAGLRAAAERREPV